MIASQLSSLGLCGSGSDESIYVVVEAPSHVTVHADDPDALDQVQVKVDLHPGRLRLPLLVVEAHRSDASACTARTGGAQSRRADVPPGGA